ncbi:hypothetical protein [Nocardia sp. IFM 10818]
MQGQLTNETHPITDPRAGADIVDAYYAGHGCWTVCRSNPVDGPDRTPPSPNPR